MAFILNTLIEILSKPTAADVMLDLMFFAAPLWVAVLAGLLIGWSWRPRWAAGFADGGGAKGSPVAQGMNEDRGDGSVAEKEQPKLAVGDEDLHHLCQLVEVTDGGLPWNKMMEKVMPNFTYRAWSREPENGPPEYRSSTIFEDANPETVRDFFWDDEFRISDGWDDMLLQHKALEECETTGTMVVQWVRKFPFFCSDREYIIGRRIWQSGNSYYCVTKGIKTDSVPRRNRPRRVDLYYSSWCIRAAESKRDGRMTACEVLLFHHEDMGIPWSIAKLGVKQGMWGCVKKIEPGLRNYQTARISGQPLSRPAYMAHINTKFDADQLRSMESSSDLSSEIVEAKKQRHWVGNVPRFIVIGSAVALACTLDKGLLTKALIFGVARRFAK